MKTSRFAPPAHPGASTRGPVYQFKDIALVCFGRRGAILADACFLGLLFCICALFVVLIAENLAYLAPFLTKRWWVRGARQE